MKKYTIGLITGALLAISAMMFIGAQNNDVEQDIVALKTVFVDLGTDIRDLEDDFNRNRRKTSQTLSEIQQAITLLQVETKEIKDKISEKDKKKKK